MAKNSLFSSGMGTTTSLILTQHIQPTLYGASGHMLVILNYSRNNKYLWGSFTSESYYLVLI